MGKEYLEFAGYRVHRPGDAESFLEQAERYAGWIAATILRRFPRQCVTPESGVTRVDHAIEHEGKPYGVLLFPGFRPEIKSSDYHTRQHRAKRRQYLKLQRLCMAYLNARQAIDVYHSLTEQVGEDCDGLDMLASSAFNFGEQWSQFLQWDAQQSKESAKQRSKRKGTGDLTPDQWRQVTKRVDFLSRQTKSRVEAAKLVLNELTSGEYGTVENLPSVDTIRRKKLS